MDDITVINAQLVNEVINQDKQQIMSIVKQTYLNFQQGACINPGSFFLRFPDSDRNRIIGLAASNVMGENQISGIKWVASYPDNLRNNLPRASASIILNDYMTGRVKAFIEGSSISASRTAASAALAAQLLVSNKKKKHILFFVGCGVIARTILDFMYATDINIDSILVYDLNVSTADKFKRYITETYQLKAQIAANINDGLNQADMMTFATTEIKPFVSMQDIAPNTLKDKIILGISLRDLCPDVIIEANNILDDVDHCLQANTSVHLTEQKYKNRQFINGNICDLINGSIVLHPNKPTIFSPFGMGVLDLNVAKYVYDYIKNKGLGVSCSFHE